MACSRYQGRRIILTENPTEAGQMTVIPFPMLFRDDDKPSLLERTASGIIVHARWHYNGELHRVGGPAVIRSDRTTGVRTLEEWWQFGILHRQDGPAIIERDAQTGEITLEEWRWPERRSMTMTFRPAHEREE
jgi:hypothetical protein